MAFVSAQGPTVVDQTTLMKKYLQFVAALTDVNTRKTLSSTESYSSSRTCFTNIVILFRQLIKVCGIQFKFRLSFNFLKKQNDEKYLHEPKWARCVCAGVRRLVVSCVPCNWAVIAKLIRSDCFFGQWAWYFSSWCSFALNFFAWISIFSWWNQVENDARSQWEFWGK